MLVIIIRRLQLAQKFSKGMCYVVELHCDGPWSSPPDHFSQSDGSGQLGDAKLGGQPTTRGFVLGLNEGENGRLGGRPFCYPTFFRVVRFSAHADNSVPNHLRAAK